MQDNLKQKLKEFIVATLRLQDVRPEDIGDEDLLFGEGLGLDSIDGLELAVSLEKEYGIKIGSSEESRKALRSINSLAEFITSRTEHSHPAD